MNIFKKSIPIILGLLLLGCGSSVQTIRPNKADLSKYETFAYLPNASIELEDAPEETDFLNSFIIETMNEEMEAAGYELDRDDPDLLVLISVSTDLATKRESQPVYATYPYTGTVVGSPINPYYRSIYYRGWYDWYYPGGVIGYTTDTYSYKEGTVVIDLVDAETKQSVWKGITSEPILRDTETESIQESIRDIFEDYPLSE